jgi:hypothetical protein
LAEPALELDAQDEKTSSPTYDLPIINGGVVDTTITLRFGGPESADGSIKNVQRPDSGNKWAEDFWLDDSDGTDTQLTDENTDPDAATQPYMTFKLTSDAVSFASKPRITIYDDSGRTETEEVCVGTTNHTSPLVKGRIQTANTQPSQYWGEASSAALHGVENAGAVEPPGNNGLCGETNYLQCNSVDINTTPHYFSLALSVPDDITPGINSIDCLLAIRYTYT